MEGFNFDHFKAMNLYHRTKGGFKQAEIKSLLQ